MALAIAATGTEVVGIDINEARLEAIRARHPDLPAADMATLDASLRDGRLELTSCSSVLAVCRTVVTCVPTPIDQHLTPDLRPLRGACQDVVDHAVGGQLIVLTSTTYVGSTRDLLVEPLRARGLSPGEDIFVAFSPERLVVASATAPSNGVSVEIDLRSMNGDGNGHTVSNGGGKGVRNKSVHAYGHGQVNGNGDGKHREDGNNGCDGDSSLVRWMRTVPRIVGGVTPECTARAASVLRCFTDVVHRVSSPEVAEYTKLIENTFRAVNIALANEFAEIGRAFGVDVIEALGAAGTKPYGFMRFDPGPGVGGHCIPCDPHYLLWALRAKRIEAPLIQRAMTEIAQRPGRVAGHAVEAFAELGRPIVGSRVLIFGVAFKPGVSDIREAPALEIMSQLRERGAVVEYHDPFVDRVRLRTGEVLSGVDVPGALPWDLVIIHTVHPGSDLSWVDRVPAVVDASYRLPRLRDRLAARPADAVAAVIGTGKEGERLCGLA
ncbi:MAG: nucleotide sugar dehydrogenase [Acidimicrobiia bacterium]